MCKAFTSLYMGFVCVCVCVFVCLCVHLWVVIKVFMRVLQYFGRVKGSAFRTLRVQSCRVWGFGSLGFAWLRVAGFEDFERLQEWLEGPCDLLRF